MDVGGSNTLRPRIPRPEPCEGSSRGSGSNVNGEQKATKSASGKIATTNNPLYIGTKNANTSVPEGDFWKGQLDEIRIWNQARTGEEIKATLNRSLSGQETGLVAYYPVVSGTQLVDRSSNKLHGNLIGGPSFVTLETSPDSLVFQEQTKIKFPHDLEGTIKGVSELKNNLGIYQGTITVEVDSSRQNEITVGTVSRVEEETVIVELLPGEGYILPENPQATLKIQDDDVPGVRIVQVSDNTVVKEGETASFQVSLLSEPNEPVTIRLTPGFEIDFVDPINPTTVKVSQDVYTFDETNAGGLDVNLISLITSEQDQTIAFDIESKQQPESKIIVEFYDANDTSNNKNPVKSVLFTNITKNEITGTEPGNWNQEQQVIMGYLDPDSQGNMKLTAIIKDATTKAQIGNPLTLPINYTTTEVEKQTTEITIQPQDWYKLQTVTFRGFDEGVPEPGLYHESNITYQVSSPDLDYHNLFVPVQRVDVVDRPLNPENTSQTVGLGLTNLQDSLDNLTIPLVGSLEGKMPNLIGDINDKLVVAIAAESDLTANRLKTVIENALASLNLDFVEVSVDMTEDNVAILLNVTQEYELFSLPLDVNLGLDALGIGVKTEGDLKTTFDFNVALGFGLIEPLPRLDPSQGWRTWDSGLESITTPNIHSKGTGLTALLEG